MSQNDQHDSKGSCCLHTYEYHTKRYIQVHKFPQSISKKKKTPEREKKKMSKKKKERKRKKEKRDLQDRANSVNNAVSELHGEGKEVCGGLPVVHMVVGHSKSVCVFVWVV